MIGCRVFYGLDSIDIKFKSYVQMYIVNLFFVKVLKCGEGIDLYLLVTVICKRDYENVCVHARVRLCARVCACVRVCVFKESLTNQRTDGRTDG